MAEEESDEGDGGGKKKLIIIVAILVLLLGGGAGAAIAWKLGYFDKPEEGANANATQEEFAEDDGREKAGSSLEKADNPIYFYFPDPKGEDGGAYIVNLMDRRNFLRIKLAAEVELDEVSVMEYLKAREPIIDDMIITLLSNYDSAALKDPRTHETMKKQIKRKMNSIFSRDFLDDYSGKGNPVKRIMIRKLILN